MSLRHHCCTGGQHQTSQSKKHFSRRRLSRNVYLVASVCICYIVPLLLFRTRIFEKEYVLLNNAVAADPTKYEQNTTNNSELRK